MIATSVATAQGSLCVSQYCHCFATNTSVFSEVFFSTTYNWLIVQWGASMADCAGEEGICTTRHSVIIRLLLPAIVYHCAARRLCFGSVSGEICFNPFAAGGQFGQYDFSAKKLRNYLNHSILVLI